MNDRAWFLRELSALAIGDKPALDRARPLVAARAPGRLDVMGGIADYCGSLVLELPLREATWVAVQASRDDHLHLLSLGAPGMPNRGASFPMGDVARASQEGYATARALFSADLSTAWSAYLAGTLVVLAREAGLTLNAGLTMIAGSQVPEGKGVSSSAALEVAAMQAVAAHAGIRLAGCELARLCQRVENLVVGAPCGIMDQMTSALGEEGKLLALLCQPAEVQGYVPLPPRLGVWGIDSGIRHAVSGSDYTAVRVGAFMGYRILAERVGLAAKADGPAGRVTVDDPQWHGYLANVGSRPFAELAACLPESMRGDEFLKRYGGTTDTVTRVDQARTYAVRQPTAHPVFEHERVTRFARLLERAAVEPDAAVEMGRLMFESHASYSECGLGSDGTDRLVEMVRQAGAKAGLYGAKITGGGSGGTVAVLGQADAAPAVAEIARRYAEETGRGGYVFAGSSPGARQHGVVHLAPPWTIDCSSGVVPCTID